MNKRARDTGLFLLLLSFAAFVIALIFVSYAVNYCDPSPSGGCLQGGSVFPLAAEALGPAILSVVLFVAGVGVLAASRGPKVPSPDDDLDAVG